MSDRSTLYQKLEYSVPNSFQGKARDPSQTLTLDCALKLLLVGIRRWNDLDEISKGPYSCSSFLKRFVCIKIDQVQHILSLREKGVIFKIRKNDNVI